MMSDCPRPDEHLPEKASPFSAAAYQNEILQVPITGTLTKKAASYWQE
jgi:hypothetical protein